MDSQAEFSFDDALLAQIDTWRAAQDVRPSRAAAISDLVRAGLRNTDEGALSIGDKLTLSVLCAISRKLDAEGMIDPDFLDEAIRGGHAWAIQWEHPSLSHGHSNSATTADFVVRVLAMWKRIEEGFQQLSADDKQRVRGEAGLSSDPQFPGWCSLDEANCKSIARFMTDKMELFPTFQGRAALDSGAPAIGRYKAMLRRLDGFAQDGGDRRLNAEELSRLLVTAET
jgi:uncharacterized protein YfbU (UPF0304 family)